MMDMDQVISQDTGLTPARLIQDQGWEGFRRIEKKLLWKTRTLDQIVVSTGGGIVMDAENQVFIKKNGYAVWLDAGAETILKRLQADGSTADFRPALTSAGVLAETRDMLEVRRPLYERTAHLRIETDTLTPCMIVTLIERSLF